MLGLIFMQSDTQVTTPSTHNTGALRPAVGIRKGMKCLVLASIFMAATTGARADVFGGGAASAPKAEAAALLERIAAMEREIKELKEKGPVANPNSGGQPGVKQPGGKTAGHKAGLKLPPPPPGLDGLPSGGSDERERMLVQKELTHEVIGTVNGKLMVRDGDARFILSQEEFTAFEKKKREKVVARMKLEAMTEGDGGRVNFPQLSQLPPPPPDISGAAADTVNTGAAAVGRAAQVVEQSRAIEANGGRLPSPPPGATPAKNTGAASAAQPKPAPTVKK